LAALVALALMNPAIVRFPEATIFSGRLPVALIVTPPAMFTLPNRNTATPPSLTPVMFVGPGPVIVSAVVLAV
jgi:hypothetical protein